MSVSFRASLFLLFVSAFVVSAHARPVSYPGGWTVMQRNNGHFYSLHTHYSPTAKYSLGYRGEYWRESKLALHSLALNNLLKRWNRPASQANLYLKSGVGFGYDHEGENKGKARPLVYSLLATDWEDRRFFAGYQIRGHYADTLTRALMQTGRVGIAPYIAGYKEFHTWIMFEAEHTPGEEHTWTFTPLLRFFSGPYLAEVGASTRGDLMANWIIRF